VDVLHTGISFLEPYIQQYGLYAIFAIIYLESFGAPLPGESVLIASSLLAIRGDLAVGDLFFAVWTAAVLGDSTGYAIGRFGGRPLLRRYGWLVKLTPERLEKLEELFRRRGPIIVFGARFVVVLRQLNGVVAGSVGMAWHSFVFANILGAALWAAVWSVGPYFFGGLFHSLWG
jgi:membrane protein DedA with SNARE-associated domain